MENKSERCISVTEMGRRLGISKGRAYQLANSEGFPSFRIGKRIVVNSKLLDDWLDKQAKKQGA